MKTRLFLPLLLLLLTAPVSHACFGAQLRVGVVEGGELAAYFTGFFVEEKTGIVPDFKVTTDPLKALAEEKIDIFLAQSGDKAPEGLLVREVGEIPGLGKRVYWMRSDVVEDLRFTTVERALGIIGRFFSTSHYREAVAAPNPKKAARKAVNDGS